MKVELLELKEQHTQEKQNLNLQVSENKITKKEAMQATFEISKKYTQRIEELSETLHTL
ncbi:hypothetical protein [Flectobacillus major]|uniref:hypothetical protein n=1 Tax=Flectobacillus major TaxID=103 RepID=UPI0004032356|nr:hypothetical protein [Flectobacillus major]